MLSIDMKNAANKTGTNFTCLLMQLLCKSDLDNFRKLSSVYPIEANMVWIYKNHCPYINKERTEVDYKEIEKRAKELYNVRHKDK
jgi:hypothetical protein